MGYRTGLAHDEQLGERIATAKRDDDGQFYVVRAEDEETAVAELAVSVGIDIEE